MLNSVMSVIKQNYTVLTRSTPCDVANIKRNCTLCGLIHRKAKLDSVITPK